MKTQFTTAWSVMTERFTEIMSVRRKKFHAEVSSWRSVLTAKCPHGELSSGQNVPYVEVFVWQSVRTAKCPTAKCPAAKILTAKSPDMV